MGLLAPAPCRLQRKVLVRATPIKLLCNEKYPVAEPKAGPENHRPGRNERLLPTHGLFRPQPRASRRGADGKLAPTGLCLKPLHLVRRRGRPFFEKNINCNSTPSSHILLQCNCTTPRFFAVLRPGRQTEEDSPFTGLFLVFVCIYFKK